MPDLTRQSRNQSVGRTLFPRGTDKALAVSGDIMDAAHGGTTGEDVHVVLGRKPDFKTGSTDPVFANETAQFYLNTTNNKLFIRGTVEYHQLVEEDNVVGSGTNEGLPVDSDHTIYYRTDEEKIVIREKSGTGSYTWLGPFFTGSYELRIVYSALDNPGNPAVTWNAANRTFNINNVSPADWTTDATLSNRKWWRVIGLPRSGTTPNISPNIRIGDASYTASQISYTNSAHPAIDNVDEALDTALARTSTAPTGDTDVQVGEFTSGWTYSNPLIALQTPNTTGYHSFTLDNALRNLVTTYGTALSISAAAAFTTEAGSAGAITIRFGVTDNSNNFHFSEDLTIEATNARVTGRVKVFGNLPSNFTSGRFLARVISNTGDPVDLQAGIDSVKFRIEPDEDASSVPVDRTQFGNNIPSDDADIKTSQNTFEVIDELPLQLADTYDLTFPGTPNGIDDNGEWEVRRMPLERLLRIRNARPQQQFIGKIQYNSAYIAGSQSPPQQPNPDTVDFTFRIWSNLPETISNTALEARPYLEQRAIANQPVAAAQQNVEVAIPNDCTELAVGFKSDTGQNDARLLITDFDCDIELGINSSGFSGNLSDEIHSIQSLAQEVNDLTISAATTAANVSVTNTEFSNPHNYSGGYRQIIDQSIRDVVPGLVNDPTNQREVNIKGDYLLEKSWNPFRYNQNLNTGPPSFGNNFAASASDTTVESDDIDVPNALVNAPNTNISVRLQFRVSAISSFTGDIRFINGSALNTNQIAGTVDHNITATAAGQYVDITQTIREDNIEDPFRIQVRQSAGSITLTDGFVLVSEEPAATGMAQGSSEAYRESIIWVAGGTSTSRYTTVNVHQSLLPGHQWTDYDFLQFNFDTASGADLVKPCIVTSNAFQSTDGYGTIWHTDLYAILVRPVGTGNNQFEIRWNGGGSLGLRRILGINTARTAP